MYGRCFTKFKVKFVRLDEGESSSFMSVSVFTEKPFVLCVTDEIFLDGLTHRPFFPLHMNAKKMGKKIKTTDHNISSFCVCINMNMSIRKFRFFSQIEENGPNKLAKSISFWGWRAKERKSRCRRWATAHNKNHKACEATKIYSHCTIYEVAIWLSKLENFEH